MVYLFYPTRILRKACMFHFSDSKAHSCLYLKNVDCKSWYLQILNIEIVVMLNMIRVILFQNLCWANIFNVFHSKRDFCLQFVIEISYQDFIFCQIHDLFFNSLWQSILLLGIRYWEFKSDFFLQKSFFYFFALQFRPIVWANLFDWFFFLKYSFAKIVKGFLTFELIIFLGPYASFGILHKVVYKRDEESFFSSKIMKWMSLNRYVWMNW